MRARRRRRRSVYRGELEILEEIRIWLRRRHEAAPLVACSDGVTRPRWTPGHVRRTILAEIRRLRAVRAA